MKIKIIHGKEDLQILAELKKAGIPARLVKGGICIEKEFSRGEEYILPTLIQENIRAVCIPEERGEGLSNTGRATIICGNNGEALQPVFVPSRPFAGTAAAYFELQSGTMIEISRWHSEITVTITQFEVKILDGKVKYEETEIWSGTPEELPNCLSQYEPAVKAGIEKAECYHCRCAHYIRQ